MEIGGQQQEYPEAANMPSLEETEPEDSARMGALILEARSLRQFSNSTAAAFQGWMSSAPK